MKRIAMIAASAVLTAAAAHAQFGGVVYDPTQAANAARQIQQGVQMYNTAVQSQRQLINQYNQMKQMATTPGSYFTQYSNQGMQSWAPVSTSANTYGNTQQYMNSLLNGSNASAANQAASISPTGQINGYGSMTTTGQQAIAAQGATINLNDAANATTLQTLGTIRATSSQQEADIQKLEAASHSTNPADQTQAAQLQRINEALLLQLRAQQQIMQMQQAQAMQTMVQNKAQQDGMKRAMQSAAATSQNSYMPSTGGTIPVSTTH